MEIGQRRDGGLLLRHRERLAPPQESPPNVSQESHVRKIVARFEGVVQEQKIRGLAMLINAMGRRYGGARAVYPAEDVDNADVRPGEQTQDGGRGPPR